MKLAVVAMKLALGHVISKAGMLRPIFLLDDMVAELDQRHAAAAFSLLARQGVQALVTAVDDYSLKQAWPNEPFRVFHVEQGSISEAS